MHNKIKGNYNGVSRRVISIVLAIALICSFGLTSVFAESGARTTNSGVKYTVTVTGGTTDKATAAKGETVTITANAAEEGYVFDKWTTTSGVTFENESIIETSLTMPASDVTVVATYKVDKTDLEGFIFGIYEILFDENGYLMIKISEDGTEVPENKEWVTQEEYDIFELVFLAAIDVLDAPDATPEAVAKAINDLSLATDEFSAAMKPGSSIVVTVSAEKETIAIDEATTLTAVVEGDGGAGYTLTWLSDNDEVVTLELEENLKILVTGVGRGTSKIDVSLDEGVTVADSVTITVMASLENLGEDIAGIEGYFFDGDDLIIKPSEDGENISKNDMWAPSEACEAFIEAFNAAVKVYDEQLAAGENVNVDIVDEAYGVFETACFEFGELVKVGKAELADAITVAETAKTDVVIGTDAANVDVGTKWVTQAEMDALTTAIIAAEAAKDTVRYEADVTAAATAMTTATATFNNAKKDGTGVTPPAATEHNITVTNGISDMETAAEGDIVTITGKAVPAGEMFDKWTSTTSGVIFEDESIIETSFTMPASDVKVVANYVVDTIDLEALINEIEFELFGGDETRDIFISEDGKGVPADEGWVTQAAYDTFVDAIDEAILVLEDKETTFADVEKAYDALETAYEKFGDAIHHGLRVDKDNLKDLFDKIGDKYLDEQLDVNVLTSSKNGTDIPADKKWVTPEAYDAFTNAVGDALEVLLVTGETQDEVDGAFIALEKALKIFESQIKTGTYVPSSSGGGSSSGSSSTSPSVDAPSSNVGATGEVKSENLKQETADAVKEALAVNKNATAKVTVKNADAISPAALKEMATAAKAAGGKAQLMADSVVNGAIEARLYIDPAKATTLKESIKLGVKTNSLGIDATKEKFGKYFANEIAIASFEQQGSFGMEIQAAVKIDLTKLDTKKLVFYSYDKATNTYVPIVTKYTIDKNGYVHFTTAVGGDIIITDKALTKKK